MGDGRVLGEARDYPELVDILRARVDELNVSLASVDEVAGLTDTFSSHALATVPNKSILGAVTLGAMLGALGLRLQVIEDPERLEKSRRHPGWQERRAAYVRRPRSISEMFIRRAAAQLLEQERAEAAVA